MAGLGVISGGADSSTETSGSMDLVALVVVDLGALVVVLRVDVAHLADRFGIC
jgi:hypothetical protein